MTERKQGPGERARKWWLAMQPDQPGADPGTLARLRRASTPVQAAAEARTITLYRRLVGDDYRRGELERVATLAAVIAHIRKDPGSAKPTARLLGEGEDPIMSPLRFSSLIAARDAGETLRGFRQVVALLGGKAPVADMATALFDWTHPIRGEIRKTRWLFEYHAATPPPDDAFPDADAASDPAGVSA